MRRKGQAALEFLTTYGWAILVVLVMIGAISYFGIMNPSKILPSRCTASTEISCVDYQIVDGSPSQVKLHLTQGVGKTVYFQGATCVYAGEDPVAATASIDDVELDADDPWSPRSPMDVECAIDSLAGMKGQKVKILFTVTYTQSVGGFPHTSEGELFTEVQ